ncbi:TRAP transporter large permease subunit [Halomonadaceae bacterium KBTZ08]
MSEPSSSWGSARAPAHARRLHGALVLLLLLALLLMGLGGSMHTRMLALGEQIWPGYYSLDPGAEAPSCETDVDIGRRVQEELSKQEDDPFGLGGGGPSKEQLRRSIEKNVARCQQRHEQYHAMQERITPVLVAYKTVERGMAEWLTDNRSLSTYLFIALLGFGAATAAFSNHHISIRPPITRVDWRLAEGGQMVVNLLMVFSLYNHLGNLMDTPETGRLQALQKAWMALFTILAGINLVRLVSMPTELPRGKMTLASPLAIPLYCWMGVLGYLYFANGGNWDTAGLGVYLNQLTKHSSLFVNIGLYVFVGMMLKQTTIPDRLLAVVQPWQLPPATLASLVIFVTAFPTAFTGASGIFILAVGGTIYDELRRAGAGRQLSLATTAMSGSLGVVLNPCLLIVVVAALNKEVTTGELFGWGFWVFLLSAIIFTLIVTRSEKEWRPRVSHPRLAMKQSLKALRALIPDVILIAVIVGLFQLVLGMAFNEFSAPTILPIIMMALVVLDYNGPRSRVMGAGRRIAIGAGESAVHVGALLTLIGLSMTVGGVLERSHVIASFFPAEADSVLLVVLALMVLLTVIGMFMDPFAAVVLVSATIAQPAIGLGVDPLHFWVMTIVAFELGYLTPPVALNHLLTRQVVGVKEALVPEPEAPNLYRRFQRLILPLMVMGLTLTVVALVPLLFYG